MASKRRECKNDEIQMFAGLVKCSHCGSSLNLSYDAKKQKYKNFNRFSVLYVDTIQHYPPLESCHCGSFKAITIDKTCLS